MANFDYNLFFLVVSNFTALGLAIWRLAIWEEKLQYQIKLNKKDINDGLESLRREMKQRDTLMSIQLNTLIKLVEKTSDYQPPTMNDFSDK
jgi:hypothetical protein